MPNPPVHPGSDEEFEQLLLRLRQQPAAHPQPFFYARVQARLQAKASAPLVVLPRWLRRPAYAILLGLLVLAVSGDSAAAAHAAPPGRHLARW